MRRSSCQTWLAPLGHVHPPQSVRLCCGAHRTLRFSRLSLMRLYRTLRGCSCSSRGFRVTGLNQGRLASHGGDIKFKLPWAHWFYLASAADSSAAESAGGATHGHTGSPSPATQLIRRPRTKTGGGGRPLIAIYLHRRRFTALFWTLSVPCHSDGSSALVGRMAHRGLRARPCSAWG